MRITKIITVTDTREYEEQGDRFVPIPGSGQINVCARCGKDHEVHALVELEDESTAIVGTGCMRAETDEIKSRARRLTSAAKRLARLRAELAGLEQAQVRNGEIEAMVAELVHPPVLHREQSEERTRKYPLTAGRVYFACGPCEAYADRFDGRVDMGAGIEAARKAWTEHELYTRGYRWIREDDRHEIERKIKALEKKIAG